MSPPTDDDDDTATIYVEVSIRIVTRYTYAQNNGQNFVIGHTPHHPHVLTFHQLLIQGKRKMVDGFVRWCVKGTAKVGLSQTLEVVEAVEEVATGLYDGFYVKMPESEEDSKSQFILKLYRECMDVQKDEQVQKLSFLTFASAEINFEDRRSLHSRAKP